MYGYEKGQWIKGESKVAGPWGRRKLRGIGERITRAEEANLYIYIYIYIGQLDQLGAGCT